jgi:hypothetical protein
MIQYEFARFYFSQATGSAFQSLYENYEGIQDGYQLYFLHSFNFDFSFVGYWETVVTYFKDSPYVLGYELINEPVNKNSSAVILTVNF